MNAPKIHRQYIQTLVNAAAFGGALGVKASGKLSMFASSLLVARGDYMDVVSINESEGEHALSNAFYRAAGQLEALQADATEALDAYNRNLGLPRAAMAGDPISNAVTQAIGGVDRYLAELTLWHNSATYDAKQAQADAAAEYLADY